MRSALLCASSAERIFIISRLSRSAERSKRYFHGRGRNGKRHLQRRFLRKRGAVGKRLALSVKPCRSCQLSQRESPWHGGKVSGKAVNFAGGNAPPGGAVAQRLRGYGWRSEKSVKAIAPTGAALAFLCFDFFFRIVKGEQPLARCGVGGVQR